MYFMDFKQYTNFHNLEKYSFLWSEASLLISAVALFIGGIPPIFKIIPSIFYGITASLLGLAWIISGVAAVYLLYRWNANNRMLFNTIRNMDTAAFMVSIILGLNLGVTGIMGINIAMSISSSTVLFIITGILFIVSAGYLYKRWNESGKKIF